MSSSSYLPLPLSFRPLPFLPTLLSLLFSLLSLLSFTNSQGPVLTSVSGCVDVDNITTQCVFPLTLTVRGSGFFTGYDTSPPIYTNSPWLYIHPVVSLSPQAVQRGWQVPTLWADNTSPVNDSFFVFQLTYWGSGVLDDTAPLQIAVSLGPTQSRIASPPFSGVTLAPITPPTITAISGCPSVTADGQSTLGCLPDRDVVTVTGSGFLLWEGAPMVLCVGTLQNAVWFRLNSTTPTALFRLYNDSVLTLSLLPIYPNLLAVHDFGGPVLPLFIQESITGVVTRSLSIQFDALPPPSYTSITPWNPTGNLFPLCQWDVNQTALVNCVAGGSGFQLRGHYLFGVSVQYRRSARTPQPQPPAGDVAVTADSTGQLPVERDV